MPVSILSGWSIIGGFNKPISVSQMILATPEIKSVYGYEGAYYEADTLEPGKGYWIKNAGAPINDVYLDSYAESIAIPTVPKRLRTAVGRHALIYAVYDKGTIVLHLGVKSPELGELPPIPPTGSADARITMKDYDSRFCGRESKEYPIRFQGIRELRWDLEPGQFETWSIELADGRRMAIKDEGSIDLEGGVVHGFVHRDTLQNFPPFELTKIFPTPFNSTATVEYEIATAGYITLDIFNVAGQRVRVLISKNFEPGTYRSTWDGRGDNGSALGAGIYFLRMHNSESTQTKKMILTP